MECGLQCGEVKRSPELEHMCVTGPRSCLPQWPGHFGNSINPKSIACGLNRNISHPLQTVTHPHTHSLRKRTPLMGLHSSNLSSKASGVLFFFFLMSPPLSLVFCCSSLSRTPFSMSLRTCSIGCTTVDAAAPLTGASFNSPIPMCAPGKPPLPVNLSCPLSDKTGWLIKNK